MVHRIESDDRKVKTSSTFVPIFASYNEDRKTFSMTQYASESARIIVLKSSIYKKLSKLGYQDCCKTTQKKHKDVYIHIKLKRHKYSKVINKVGIASMPFVRKI